MKDLKVGDRVYHISTGKLGKVVGLVEGTDRYYVQHSFFVWSVPREYLKPR